MGTKEAVLQEAEKRLRERKAKYLAKSPERRNKRGIVRLRNSWP